MSESTHARSAARRGRPVDVAGREAKARHILEVAAAVVARDGFHKASTNDICREAGISSAGLYQYYPSKHALIVAIAEEHRLRDIRRTAALRDGPFFEALAALAAETARDADPFEDARLVLEIFAESARDPDLRAVLARAERDVLALLADVVAQAQARGEVKADLDPRETALLLVCMFDGFYCRGYAGDRAPAIDPVLGFLRRALAPSV